MKRGNLQPVSFEMHKLLSVWKQVLFMLAFLCLWCVTSLRVCIDNCVSITEDLKLIKKVHQEVIMKVWCLVYFINCSMWCDCKLYVENKLFYGTWNDLCKQLITFYVNTEVYFFFIWSKIIIFYLHFSNKFFLVLLTTNSVWCTRNRALKWKMLPENLNL